MYVTWSLQALILRTFSRKRERFFCELHKNEAIQCSESDFLLAKFQTRSFIQRELKNFSMVLFLINEHMFW